jgi:hypothetical protein
MHRPMQVLAVTCQGVASSASSSKRFPVIPAPSLLISMTIGGISSFVEITKTMEQKLIAATAESLDISVERVQIEHVKDQSRRLLALSITFRVLAADGRDAVELQLRITKADFQVIDFCITVLTRCSIH